ncbi:MAG: hypothetical protein AAFQ35_15475, partial [Pseudomonadota bacterium]
MAEPARVMTSERSSQSATTRPRAQLRPAPDTQDRLADENTAQHLGLARLLELEERLRGCASVAELRFCIANDFRPLFNARQVFVLSRRGRHAWRIETISGAARVERESPFVRALERLISVRIGVGDPPVSGSGSKAPSPNSPDASQAAAHHIALDRAAAAAARSPDAFDTYPFSSGLFVPITRRGATPFAGILVTREAPWSVDAAALVAREARVISDTWAALAGTRARAPRAGGRRALALCALVATALAMALPVPMTTLAPVEIVARDARLVTAPIDGV